MNEKKKTMNREEYLADLEQVRDKIERVRTDPLRLKYHIQPPMGWLNDPNGLCQKDGVYHIYYQYVPFYPDLCSVLWGHATTEDFIEYQIQEPVIYPDREYDYITDGREQNTILVTSKNGYFFTEKQILMKNSDYSADMMSRHVRNPQVFCENGRYYMIQGARDLESHGSVLLLESDNLTDWKYRLRFCSEKPFGFIWECPNYLKMDGQQFFIVCLQGVEAGGFDYADSDQCGYFPLKYDFIRRGYELGSFKQLDWTGDLIFMPPGISG